MEKSEPDYDRVGDIKECKVDLDEDNIDSEVIKKSKIIKLDSNTSKLDFYTEIKEIVKEAQGNVNLEDADIIVAGGRGVGNPAGFSTIEKLAKTLNGEVGASRAVVDEGWIDKEHQVGQTGKTVKPRVYIACGISGAIQHKAGMDSSDIIIAVNTDPGAPIFEACDYGIVGDLHQVVPMLVEAFDQAVN